MKCFAIIFLCQLGINTALGQDTISFDRTIIWKYNSSELNETGKVFLNQLCDSIIDYQKRGTFVKVLYTEERLNEASRTLIEKRALTLKEYCNEYHTELTNIEIERATEFVENFEHLAPHFISYHISLVLVKERK